MGAAFSPCWSSRLLPAAACPCVTCPAANACRPPQLAARGLHSWPMHPAAATAPSCCARSLPMPRAYADQCGRLLCAAAPLHARQPQLLPLRCRSSRARAAAPYIGRAAAPREPAPLLPVQAAPQLPTRLDCSHSPLAALRAAHVSRSHRFPPPTPLAPPRASALAGPPAAKPERPRTRRSRAPRARGSCSRNRSRTCEG